MKKQLLFGGLFALSFFANAQQWTTSGSNIYNANSGNVGIGNTAPGNELHVSTSSAGDGIQIQQTAAFGGAAGLHMKNSSSGGHQWSFYSLGYTDGWGGSGCFALQDVTGDPNFPRLFITANGNTAIGGSYSPTDCRLYVSAPQYTSAPINPKQGGLFEISTSVYGTFSGVKGTASSTYNGGNAGTYIGTHGVASGNNSRDVIGAYGTASAGGNNYGGYFLVPTNTVSSFNYGVYADAVNSGTMANSWAGYFNGNMYCSGTLTQGSDRKLKKDIKPMKDGLKNLMLLKPSTYTFKIDEYKNMGLPSGQQFGLIAQDLEKVFPDLVKNMPAMSRTDEKGQTISVSPEFKSVQYISLIPVLISAIQEQQAQIEEQSKQINDLKSIINSTANSNSYDSRKATNLQSLNISDKNILVLNQNVPNPFAESTVISYNIPNKFTKAQISINTVDGKVIKTVDITTQGAGSLNIFANDLSSGIYSYSLIIDDKVVETKKMIKN